MLCVLCSVYVYSSYFLEKSFLIFLTFSDFSVLVGGHVKSPTFCSIGERLENPANECVPWYLCMNFEDVSFCMCLVICAHLTIGALFQHTPAAQWILRVQWLVLNIECGQLHGGEGAKDAEGGVTATRLRQSKTVKAQTEGERPSDGKLNSRGLQPTEPGPTAQREGLPEQNSLGRRLCVGNYMQRSTGRSATVGRHILSAYGAKQ